MRVPKFANADLLRQELETTKAKLEQLDHEYQLSMASPTHDTSKLRQELGFQRVYATKLVKQKIDRGWTW